MELEFLHFVGGALAVADPDQTLAEAQRYVGLDPHPANMAVRSNVNDAYFRRWAANRSWNRAKKFDTDRAVRRFDERVARFGYSMVEPGRIVAAEEIAVLTPEGKA